MVDALKNVEQGKEKYQRLKKKEEAKQILESDNEISQHHYYSD